MSKPFFNDSGIEIHKVYTSDSAQYHQLTELPGEFPFTRGVQADMYRGKLWTMRQYAGFSTAEESNRRYHYLLSQGVTGLKRGKHNAFGAAGSRKHGDPRRNCRHPERGLRRI